MLPEKLFFDVYTTGNSTTKFFAGRLDVKSISIEKQGPPMFLKSEFRAIKHHPYIEKFIRANKIKFNRFRKIEVIFESAKDAEMYYNSTTKTLHFKGQPLCQRAADAVVASTSGESNAQSQSANKTPSLGNRLTNRKRKSSSTLPVKNDKLSPLEEEKTLSMNTAIKEVFTLEKYMSQRGFSKFNHSKMDLYQFIDAFETGAERMKYDDRQKLTSFLFFLDLVEEVTYLNIRSHQNPADWEEFKQLFIDSYHKTIYDRCFKYVSVKYTEGSIYQFAKKKVEVLRYYLKSIPDCDLIQMITWTLPDECQRNVMPLLCTTLVAFLNAVKEYEDENEEEDEEDEETEEIVEHERRDKEAEEFHQANAQLFD